MKSTPLNEVLSTVRERFSVGPRGQHVIQSLLDTIATCQANAGDYCVQATVLGSDEETGAAVSIDIHHCSSPRCRAPFVQWANLRTDA